MTILSVAVMTYDEAANVAAVIEEIEREAAALGVDYEVVVIDDGSTDGTGAIVDALAAARPRVRVARHAVNAGLGGVYRTGFAEARGDYVTFYPADGQFPASILHTMLPLMATHDMVLGYLPDVRRPLVARVLSWGERVLYRVLLGPMPKFQGVLMFRRTLLADTPLHSTGRGWGVLMELILRTSRRGARVTSVPTALRPRMSGVSKVNNGRTIVANAKQILALREALSASERTA